MPDAPQPASTLRKVGAAILDFLTTFFALGYVVGALTGNLTPEGFDLKGGPALVLFALVIAYFVIGRRTGGTIWQRILGA